MVANCGSSSNIRIVIFLLFSLRNCSLCIYLNRSHANMNIRKKDKKWEKKPVYIIMLFFVISQAILTDYPHDITEILMKVALSTIPLTNWLISESTSVDTCARQNENKNTTSTHKHTTLYFNQIKCITTHGFFISMSWHWKYE